jgi:hypothetical protein
MTEEQLDRWIVMQRRADRALLRHLCDPPKTEQEFWERMLEPGPQPLGERRWERCAPS